MVDAPARPIPGSRKGKERETHAAADIADRIVAFQRRNHPGLSSKRDRPTISTTSPPRKAAAPAIAVSDADEYSRRAEGKTLFDARRTHEPDAISESTTSSSKQPTQQQPPPRQLFDPRRDDPVRFAAGRKPPPASRPSADYVSSASSHYAPSVASSSFTLSSSTTGDSSDPASIFDGSRGAQPARAAQNAFTVQLKKLYRDITVLENKIKSDDGAGDAADVDEGRGPARIAPQAEDAESTRWQRAIHDHKLLAEMMHQLLGISCAPSVPASLRNIPEKYSIIVRLWTYGFHRLLENLRRAALHSPVALEHLQHVIYFAYTFYTALYEEVHLAAYRPAWLEALGDLARYRMAVAAMLPQPPAPSLAQSFLSAHGRTNGGSGGLTPHPAMTPTSTTGNASSKPALSDARVARIDDSPSPSVGIVAARNFDLEPETERWRAAARGWYGAGVADTPGNGKLHHHLGLLAREAEGEELRAVYHFTKSLVALHPFPTSRESILPIWSGAAQTRRAAADAPAPALFVYLHGTLFTAIERDAFAPTLARLLERLQLAAPEGREWTMMACANVAALLEYGARDGVLRRAGAFGERGAPGTPAAQQAATLKIARARAAAAAGRDEPMDVDQPSPALSEASAHGIEDGALPPAFTSACALAFGMLAHALAHPVPARDGRPAPSPYATVLLTFLAVLARHEPALKLLARYVPWDALAGMLAHAPGRILKREDGAAERLARRGALPEDWCLRGAGWPGRGLFEKGFWGAPDAAGQREMDVLDERDGAAADDGRLEEDDAEGGEDEELGARRWARAVWAGARLARLVPGFEWRRGKEWAVGGVLREQVDAWRAEERREREEEEARRARLRARGAQAMDVDGDDGMSEEDGDEDDEDDEGATEEVRALKDRRRYLRSLLQPAAAPTRHAPRRPHRSATARPALRLVPGYTTLVLDTNVLLAAPERVRALIERGSWTLVVPLPVVMELDGLASGAPELGAIARGAVDMLAARVRAHAAALKVQTSRGNYLSSLAVRREAVDFDGGGPGAWERCMDDLILRAAVWQDEHWSDRRAVLGGSTAGDVRGAARVVLCSLDRNLRVKARARQLDAAGEEELAALFTGA